MQNLKELFNQYKIKILEIMPYCEVEHVGASSFPDIETKGDLDIQIRVEAIKFDKAVKDCESIFARRHEDLWNDEFALFNDPEEKIKIDIMLTVKDSAYDNFYKIRDAMIQNPELRKRYIDFKKQYSDFSSDDYRKAKHLFFRKLESDLGLKVRPLDNFPRITDL